MTTAMVLIKVFPCCRNSSVLQVFKTMLLTRASGREVFHERVFSPSPVPLFSEVNKDSFFFI